MSHFTHATMQDFSQYIPAQKFTGDGAMPAVLTAIGYLHQINGKQAAVQSAPLDSVDLQSAIQSALHYHLISGYNSVEPTLKAVLQTISRGYPILFTAYLTAEGFTGVHRDMRISPRRKVMLSPNIPQNSAVEAPSPGPQPVPPQQKKSVIQKIAAFLSSFDDEPITQHQTTVANAPKPSPPVLRYCVAVGYAIHRSEMTCWIDGDMVDLAMMQLLDEVLVKELWTIDL